MSMCAFDSIQMRAAHGATAVSGRTFRWNGRALLIEVRTRTQAAPTACRLLPANDHALRGASGSDALRATCAKPTRSDGRGHGTDARASRARSSTAIGRLGKVTPPQKQRGPGRTRVAPAHLATLPALHEPHISACRTNGASR